MKLNINEHYVMLNHKLQQAMVADEIDKYQPPYYTMENDLIFDYYTDLNDVPGAVAGMLNAIELSETLLVSHFE
ncbi:hypothetical protein ACFPFV_09355 [Salinicoccus siamensis]|uniref:Uncharacterized protein n=1 Tax=Salinicoccus siamensis TaxID=381830 RepID=A0ABV5Z4J4_9STAP